MTFILKTGIPQGLNSCQTGPHNVNNLALVNTNRTKAAHAASNHTACAILSPIKRAQKNGYRDDAMANKAYACEEITLRTYALQHSNYISKIQPVFADFI